jgi:hypothetical protein
MAIEAVKIPQNVYVEDRIIGPVTLKQLIITGIGGGISYVLYATTTKAGITNLPAVILCWVPAAIAAAFSFLKINDLTLFNIILLMIESMNKPNLRYWSPHPGLSINLVTRQSEKELTTADSRAALNATRLSEITEQLKKRQEDMNRLSSQEQQPSNLDAVKTRFESATTLQTGQEPDSEVVPVRSETPVDPAAVTPDQGLDPSRSIDAVTSDLKAYESLIAKSS